MRRATGVGLRLALGIGMLAGWWCLGPLAFAQDEPATGETAKEAAKEADVVSEAELAKIERSLDEVLASQQQVLQKFDAITEELGIIKVRATSRGAVTLVTPSCP